MLVYTPWKLYSTYVEEALKQEKPRRVPVCVLQHVHRSVYYTFCFGAKYIKICGLLQQILVNLPLAVNILEYALYWYPEDTVHTVKKRLANIPSPAGMSLTKLNFFTLHKTFRKACSASHFSYILPLYLPSLILKHIISSELRIYCLIRSNNNQ